MRKAFPVLVGLKVVWAFLTGRVNQPGGLATSLDAKRLLLRMCPELEVADEMSKERFLEFAATDPELSKVNWRKLFETLEPQSTER